MTAKFATWRGGSSRIERRWDCAPAAQAAAAAPPLPRPVEVPVGGPRRPAARPGPGAARPGGRVPAARPHRNRHPPPRGGVAIGIAYAMVWLVWAARTPAANAWKPRCTASPRCWCWRRCCGRPPSVSTPSPPGPPRPCCCCFTVFGLAVSWRKDLLIVATIATLAGLGTAAALLVATHDVLPFTFVFLAIAAAVEVSACLDHWLSERWLAAAAADLAVLLATWLVTNRAACRRATRPSRTPGCWPRRSRCWPSTCPAPSCARCCAASPSRSSKTAQCAVAFLIGVTGGLRLSGTNPPLAAAMAVLALLCGAACYLVSFVLLDRTANTTAATSTPTPHSASCWPLPVAVFFCPSELPALCGWAWPSPALGPVESSAASPSRSTAASTCCWH